MNERILCAAIHYDDGHIHVEQPINIKSGFVVCGHRHHNCMVTAAILANTKEYGRSGTCGFLTSLNRFVDRYEAYDVASTYIIQLKNRPHHRADRLYSEDLY